MDANRACHPGRVAKGSELQKTTGGRRGQGKAPAETEQAEEVTARLAHDDHGHWFRSPFTRNQNSEAREHQC